MGVRDAGAYYVACDYKGCNITSRSYDCNGDLTIMSRSGAVSDWLDCGGSLWNGRAGCHEHTIYDELDDYPMEYSYESESILAQRRIDEVIERATTRALIHLDAVYYDFERKHRDPNPYSSSIMPKVSKYGSQIRITAGALQNLTNSINAWSPQIGA